MGLSNTPLMCMQEIPVPGDVERCIRILVLYNTDTPQDAVRHVYLREARRLRPDLDS
jgi:chorismate mutase